MRDRKKEPYRGKSPAMQRVEKMRKKRVQRERLIVGGAAVAVVAVVFAAAHILSGKKSSNAEPESSVVIETTFASDDIRVNGISLTGMTRAEAKEAIAKAYPWKVTVMYNGETLDADNILDAELEMFLDGICTVKAAGDYTFSVTDSDALRESAKAAAEKIAASWDVKAKSSSIYDYDAASDKFLFTEGTPGIAVDQEKLASDLVDAAVNGSYDAVIAAEVNTTQPKYSEAEARERYEKLASFTTETTANEKRNTNVRLAAEAINGTIVKPGEEFSFNKIVGPRTAEKGYQEAAAYNSGEVVQELGGGVCQVSSTLYQVAFRSGMNITYRRSHTFEPNYVTPGQDAAISWEQPDFRFVNTSDKPIGILASYADRKATVSIFGVPVLEDGVVWDLASEKVEEIDPPEPEYVEDPTLAPGTENTIKAATKGSRWDTYKVVYKDGQEVERTLDHSKTYLGHSAVIHRNTSSASGTTTSGTTTSDTTASSTKGAQESSSVANPTKAAAPTKAGTTEKKAPKHETAPAQTAPAPTEPAPTAPAAPETSQPAPEETIAPFVQ